MSELIKYLAEIGAKAQEWDKVCKFGQSLLFPAGDAAYDSENETPADAVCRLLQELVDRRAKDKCCEHEEGDHIKGYNTGYTFVCVGDLGRCPCIGEPIPFATYDERDMRKMKEAEAADRLQSIHKAFCNDDQCPEESHEQNIQSTDERDMLKAKIDNSPVGPETHFRKYMAKQGVPVGEIHFAELGEINGSVYRAEPFAGVTDGITPEVTSALEAAAESFYDLRALLEKLHLLAPEATDHTAEIRIRDILNKYAVSLPHKHQAYRPFEEPSSKV